MKNLRTVRKMSTVFIYLICAPLFVMIIKPESTRVMIGALFTVLILMLVFQLKYWRCPHCGAALPSMRAEDEICPKCGKNIYRPEDDTVYETPEGEEPSHAEEIPEEIPEESSAEEAPASLPEETAPGAGPDEK